MNSNGIKMKVTVIGLGNMGSALARAFLNAGFDTTIWNRSEEKALRLIEKGAKFVSSPIEAVHASPLIVACVLNYEAASAIAERTGEDLSGKVWVNFNTGTPEEARNFASTIKKSGAKYIDGAIMDIPQSIGKKETLIFYSGSRSGFGIHQNTLMALAGKSKYLDTDPGLAKLFELGVGSTLVPTLLGFIQGAALVGTADVKAETLVPYASDWLHMIISLLPTLAQEIDNKSYGSDIASLNVFQGISHDIQAYKAAGIDPNILLPMKALIDKGISSGYGSDSITRLIELIKQPSLSNHS